MYDEYSNSYKKLNTVFYIFKSKSPHFSLHFQDHCLGLNLPALYFNKTSFICLGSYNKSIIHADTMQLVHNCQVDLNPL